MKITSKDVSYVAKLARMDLETDEMEEMTVQLDRILSYIDKLNILNTDGVDPTTHVMSINNAFREDETTDSLGQEKSLANGPNHNDESFIVPKVI